MKVGILTFQDAHNYGAVLQAYALKKYLKSLGLDARIINYHHRDIPNGFPRKRKIEKNSVLNIYKHLYSKKAHYLRWERFEGFIYELIDKDKKVYNHESELSKLDIDVWVSGSDQIWNSDITNGLNKGFFLEFDTKGKKVTYAVSMGIDKLDEKYEEEFKNYINKIDYISVREDTLKEYISNFTDKPVKKVVDPTLLLNESDYEELYLNRIIKDNYLLIYTLGPDDRLKVVAEKIAKERNLKIVEINDYKKPNYFCKQISNAGPHEFVTLFKDASYVITNSFHGTIFSIINNKEFITFTRLNRNSRMESLLGMAGLNDRLISKVDEINNIKPIDYKEVKKRMEKEINFSKEFIKEAIVEE